MRAHNAVWLFAEAVGNEYARWYASIRQTLLESERRARDTTFLCGRGGDKIRDAWRDIGPDERERLIQATPDSSFPNDTYGIMDERRSYPGQRKQKSGATTATKITVKKTTAKKTTAKTNTAKKIAAKTKTTTVKLSKAKTKRSKLSGSTQKHFQPISTIKPKRVRYSNRVTDEPMPYSMILQTRIAEMECARNEYYTVLRKEQNLRIYAAYNGGSMVGFIEAAVGGAQSAVVLARIKDKPKTVEDAFSAVALRLEDVLAALMGTALFEPDPGDEQLDPSFQRLGFDAPNSNMMLPKAPWTSYVLRLERMHLLTSSSEIERADSLGRFKSIEEPFVRKRFRLFASSISAE
ncbi:hypothetical protein PF008_g12586 [Phytophthora fragariae]|uniref:Uncharacterized protein n=1 Tax=Phytophthora fragariae TaxID=53985 RepID=A0A6G0RMZ0_9STRA|nr:hypothetical protein PF008_g12586 [Phytophthora fragariae]